MIPPVFRWFFCAQKQKSRSLKCTNLAMSIYGIFVLPLPRISFYSCIFLFRKFIPIFWWFFVKSYPSWNGRNNSVSLVEKQRAFGFYRNNNSGHNRCELLTLEIYFLESVWSSIGNETWARSGIAIVVPMKISEGARSFSRQHKTLIISPIPAEGSPNFCTKNITKILQKPFLCYEIKKFPKNL